jgi:methionyl-tRNA formyltransferase
MKFGFVTCVELGLSCMEAIYDARGHLNVAITLPDDRAANKSGRVYLDAFCAKHAIPLVKSPNVNDDMIVEAIKSHDIDWLFIIGWSQIARADVLAAPKEGVLGMHPTLLPIGRGRAAIPWAILKGLDKTGVTLFKMDGGVDTGDIIAQHEIAMEPLIDAATLYARVDEAHTALMREVFPKLKVGELVAIPQDDRLATEWPGRKPEDGRIDLNGSVHEAERLVRAVTRPYPGAFVDTDGRRLIVWKAAFADANAPRNAADAYLEFHDGVLHCLTIERSASVTPNQ